MEELVVYNPFAQGHSWPGLQKRLENRPALSETQPKTLPDSTLLAHKESAQLKAQEQVL